MPIQQLETIHTLEGERASICAAAAGSRLRRFSGLAYSGGEMRVAGYGMVVIDLAGLKSADRIPALRSHDTAKIAGTVDTVKNTGRQLNVEGTLSASTPSGIEVASTSDEGFPWQMSVGVEVQETRDVAPGAKVQVNARTFMGPILVVAQGLLKETSFVPLGADAETNVMVASGTGGVVRAVKPGQATRNWEAALEQAQARGLTKAQAISELAHREPELHRAWLQEYNSNLPRRR